MAFTFRSRFLASPALKAESQEHLVFMEYEEHNSRLETSVEYCRMAISHASGQTSFRELSESRFFGESQSSQPAVVIKEAQRLHCPDQFS